jgi:uncharacterized membrane protein YpjA
MTNRVLKKGYLRQAFNYKSGLMLHRILFWFIILANLVGAGFGFFVYYADQYAVTNPLLWSFVGDCPSYALFFAVVFYFRGAPRPAVLNRIIEKGREKGVPIPSFLKRGVPDLSFFWFMAFVGTMKYGFWTVFVLATYSQFYFTPENWLMYAVLFGAHIFMMFETMLLVGKFNVREIFIPLIIITFIVNDLSDYLLGTHPPLPSEAVGFMFPATMGMTVVFTLLAYLILVRYGKDTVL